MGFIVLFLLWVRLNGLSMPINRHIKFNVEEIIDKLAKRSRKSEIL
jgi:hypothetical protein